MCGLAGFVGTGDRDDLVAMTRALAHRGPDGEGFFIDPEHPVHLGHRRLSIVDLDGGGQPMASGDGAIVVIYNGEIYNHLDLRRALEAKGHRFLTDHSDTEVLIHGWREWQTDLPSRLNGMFAFAIWDRRQRKIFLARDRFGEKPLYWALRGGRFLFASELAALAGHRGFAPEVDRKSLMKLLAHGFIPSPNAYWRDARKLRSGAWLLLDVDDLSARQQNYWTFAIEPGGDTPAPRAAEELAGHLTRAAERRLMSDVPLGVFLSGGIDSSGVAACVGRLRGAAGVDTFSLGFTEKSFDESGFARRMAEQIRSTHHSCQLTVDTARELIPEVLGRLDEPLGDPSILPTFLLCRFARERVKVALSGDGGDELFAGYDTFAALPYARLYRRLVPAMIHGGLRRLADFLPLSNRNMSFDFKLRRGLAGMAAGPELWTPLWLAPLPPEEIGDLLQERVDPAELYAEALAVWSESRSPSLVDRMLEFYSRLYLPDNILTKVDRAAMMNGLEVRSVFLDNDLVDFVRRLPAALKIRGGVRKAVLKNALASLVPPDILNRRKKGFGIPLADWLRRESYPGSVAGADDGLARRWYDEHRHGRRDHRLFLWCWTVLGRHAPAFKPAAAAGS